REGGGGGAGRLDLGPCALERRLAPPHEDDARAAPGELERRGAADPGPAAGDERDAAGVGVRAQGTAEGRRAGGNPSHPVVDKPTSGRICLSTEVFGRFRGWRSARASWSAGRART